MSKLRLYDSTRLDGAKTCLRYYLFRFVYHWRSDQTAAPLVFGSSWGAAMDVLWANHRDLYGGSKSTRLNVIDQSHAAFIAKWTESGFAHPDDMSPDDIDELNPRTPMVALEMLHEYAEARENILADPGFELLTVEEPFIIPLDPNDASLFYVGRMDKKFRYRREILGLDHKTSSLYRKSGVFSSEWIDSWSMNDQVDGYSYAGHYQHGADFGGLWIDGALVHKTVHDGFKIVPIDKQLDQLNVWLYETHTWIDQIEANKEVLAERAEQDTPYLAAFPRNRKSCIQYNSRCAYFDICRMHANPAKIEGVPLGFKIEKWEPMDELKLQAVLGEDATDVA